MNLFQKRRKATKPKVVNNTFFVYIFALFDSLLNFVFNDGSGLFPCHFSLINFFFEVNLDQLFVKEELKSNTLTKFNLRATHEHKCTDKSTR